MRWFFYLLEGVLLFCWVKPSFFCFKALLRLRFDKFLRFYKDYLFLISHVKWIQSQTHEFVRVCSCLFAMFMNIAIPAYLAGDLKELKG